MSEPGGDWKWHFHGLDLTERIMFLLKQGPGNPVAVVGETRIGKTSHFLF
jgi:hypothetical protein